jgi:hypothetical protein
MVNIPAWWPSTSPELHPIENRRVILQRRVKELRVNTKEELNNLVSAIWKAVNVSLVNDLMDSGPQGSQEVIESKETTQMTDRPDVDRTNRHYQNARSDKPVSEHKEFNAYFV